MRMLLWANQETDCFASDKHQIKLKGLSMRKIINRFGLILGRSLIPCLALLIIGGTVWWGPWVTLVVAVALWYSVGHLV